MVLFPSKNSHGKYFFCKKRVQAGCTNTQTLLADTEDIPSTPSRAMHDAAAPVPLPALCRRPAAAGDGRKARAKRRREDGGNTLLRAPHLRGNTQPGRLRLLDAFVRAADLKWPKGHVAVDIGIGASPETTIELHRALLCAVPVIATEVRAPVRA